MDKDKINFLVSQERLNEDFANNLRFFYVAKEKKNIEDLCYLNNKVTLMTNHVSNFHRFNNIMHCLERGKKYKGFKVYEAFLSKRETDLEKRVYKNKMKGLLELEMYTGVNFQNTLDTYLASDFTSKVIDKLPTGLYDFEYMYEKLNAYAFKTEEMGSLYTSIDSELFNENLAGFVQGLLKNKYCLAIVDRAFTFENEKYNLVMFTPSTKERYHSLQVTERDYSPSLFDFKKASKDIEYLDKNATWCNFDNLFSIGKGKPVGVEWDTSDFKFGNWVNIGLKL